MTSRPLLRDWPQDAHTVWKPSDIRSTPARVALVQEASKHLLLDLVSIVLEFAREWELGPKQWTIPKSSLPESDITYVDDESGTVYGTNFEFNLFTEEYKEFQVDFDRNHESADSTLYQTFCRVGDHLWQFPFSNPVSIRRSDVRGDRKGLDPIRLRKELFVTSVHSVWYDKPSESVYIAETDYPSLKVYKFHSVSGELLDMKAFPSGTSFPVLASGGRLFALREFDGSGGRLFALREFDGQRVFSVLKWQDPEKVTNTASVVDPNYVSSISVVSDRWVFMRVPQFGLTGQEYVHIYDANSLQKIQSVKVPEQMGGFVSPSFSFHSSLLLLSENPDGSTQVSEVI